MHKIVMEITFLILENHGKSWNCGSEFLWEPSVIQSQMCFYFVDLCNS